ncbi:hypothetical protein O181_069549 [Austropuccinia psidii MF-1]|uniref:CCHC-type domain-containing protein n=1 Tax=Austropuccinia psidii MF-1 TaxID=1389203 RepID=A0A9Q3EZI3_9BASI|nr:hypothetical protein [Austropuccinia psidii MF-1]
MDINANCDNTPIRIKAFTQYPSGDIKLYTKSRAKAWWLLENRAGWTHCADPLFVTSPPTFPVIVPSCPTYVDVEDDICKNSLLEQNKIQKEDVDRIQWLGHPKEEDKSHGSLIIHIANKQLAHQILRGGLIFNGNFMRMMAYTPGPPQCFNCLKTGHQEYQCKNTPTCSKCGGTHSPQDCKDLGYTPSIRRINWQTHDNRPNLGKPYKKKSPTSNASPTEQSLFQPPPNSEKNHPSKLKNAPTTKAPIDSHRQATTIDLPRRPMIPPPL